MDGTFSRWRESRKGMIAATLNAGLAGDAPFATPLAGILAEVVGRPGKGYRPLLTLAAAETFGVEEDTPRHASALRVAAACEYFHVASLVYDDLPGMDNAAARRGVPPLHTELERRFPGRGPGMAVLAAHSLTAAGFGLLGACGLSPAAVARLIGVFADAIGSARMAAGQALDLTGYPDAVLARALGVDTPRAVEATTLKTAPLFGAAALAGGIAALDGLSMSDGAMRACFNHLADAGQALGQAYQLADDYRDTNEDRVNGIHTVATECREAVPAAIHVCLRHAEEGVAAAWRAAHAGRPLSGPLPDYLEWMGQQCRS